MSIRASQKLSKKIRGHFILMDFNCLPVRQAGAQPDIAQDLLLLGKSNFIQERTLFFGLFAKVR